VQVRKADLAIGQGGVEANETSVSAPITIEEGDIALPDLLTDLQDRTQLTRKSIVERLESTGLLSRKIAIGVDQAGISEIVDELSRRGIEAERIGGVPQGWKLNNAIKTTERKLAGGALKHGGSRMMAFAVSNAKAEARGNAITITKQVAGSAKIDPLMALFDAVVAMGLNPESAASVYERRGLLIL